MIVAPLDGALRVVTQNDHAHFAAELLGLWRPLADHPRRDSLLLAAREHDNGWREADSAPRRREDGRPHDFLSIPEPLRRELWQRGTERARSGDPWAALLILEHALTLHRDRGDQPEWQQLLETWKEQRETLLEELREAGATETESDLADDYRLLDLADLASLKVTCPWPERQERHGFTLEGADDGLRLAPLPLVGSTRFEIPCRTIPDRPYDGDQDLAVELAVARWESMTVRVALLERGGGPI